MFQVANLDSRDAISYFLPTKRLAAMAACPTQPMKAIAEAASDKAGNEPTN